MNVIPLNKSIYDEVEDKERIREPSYLNHNYIWQRLGDNNKEMGKNTTVPTQLVSSFFAEYIVRRNYRARFKCDIWPFIQRNFDALIKERYDENLIKFVCRWTKYQANARHPYTSCAWPYETDGKGVFWLINEKALVCNSWSGLIDGTITQNLISINADHLVYDNSCTMDIERVTHADVGKWTCSMELLLDDMQLYEEKLLSFDLKLSDNCELEACPRYADSDDFECERNIGHCCDSCFNRVNLKQIDLDSMIENLDIEGVYDAIKNDTDKTSSSRAIPLIKVNMPNRLNIEKIYDHYYYLFPNYPRFSFFYIREVTVKQVETAFRIYNRDFKLPWLLPAIMALLIFLLISISMVLQRIKHAQIFKAASMRKQKLADDEWHYNMDERILKRTSKAKASKSCSDVQTSYAAQALSLLAYQAQYLDSVNNRKYNPFDGESIEAYQDIPFITASGGLNKEQIRSQITILKALKETNVHIEIPNNVDLDPATAMPPIHSSLKVHDMVLADRLNMVRSNQLNIGEYEEYHDNIRKIIKDPQSLIKLAKLREYSQIVENLKEMQLLQYKMQLAEINASTSGTHVFHDFGMTEHRVEFVSANNSAIISNFYPCTSPVIDPYSRYLSLKLNNIINPRPHTLKRSKSEQNQLDSFNEAIKTLTKKFTSVRRSSSHPILFNYTIPKPIRETLFTYARLNRAKSSPKDTTKKRNVQLLTNEYH
ncbi:hypothetical protein SNEBB_005108 [Seison nebaliae]|nr:hypothetical protein SNEBB_005108 [Seison nebaliae]